MLAPEFDRKIMAFGRQVDSAVERARHKERLKHEYKKVADRQRVRQAQDAIIAAGRRAFEKELTPERERKTEMFTLSALFGGIPTAEAGHIQREGGGDNDQ